MIEIGPNLSEALQAAMVAVMAIAFYWFIFRS
jgi:hypothetical protein